VANLPAIRLDRLAADREAEPQAGAIASSLAPGRPEEVGSLLRRPTALILDLEENPAVLGTGPQRDEPLRRRVLEGVLEQVHEGEREERGVHVDGQRGVDGLHGEPDVPVLGVQVGGDGNLVDEGQGRHPVSPRLRRGETDFRQRGVDDLAQPHQAPTQHRAGAPGHPHRPGLEHLEGEQRRLQPVAELVRQLPQALDLEV
jgi:hypothetical protein